MASLMPLRSPLLNTFAKFLSPLWNIGAVRQASKKASATSRNKRKRTPGKNRGWKRQDGGFVHCGETLVRQLGLRFYPGENVRLGRDNTLYSMTDGKVVVTSEKLSPYPDSPLYEPVKNGVIIYKKFFNVLPTPLHGKFRLVTQV
jgi:large subunit ribosomal protein L27